MSPAGDHLERQSAAESDRTDISVTTMSCRFEQQGAGLFFEHLTEMAVVQRMELANDSDTDPCSFPNGGRMACGTTPRHRKRPTSPRAGMREALDDVGNSRRRRERRGRCRRCEGPRADGVPLCATVRERRDRSASGRSHRFRRVGGHAVAPSPGETQTRRRVSRPAAREDW